MTDGTRWHPFDASGQPGWYRREGSRVRVFVDLNGRDPNGMSEDEIASLMSQWDGCYSVE
jgi:hypothetical protein